MASDRPSGLVKSVLFHTDAFTSTQGRYSARWKILSVVRVVDPLPAVRVPSIANPITRVAAKKLSKALARGSCDRQIIESHPVAEWHSTLCAFGVNEELRHSRNPAGSSEPVRDSHGPEYRAPGCLLSTKPALDKDRLSRIQMIHCTQFTRHTGLRLLISAGNSC